ncbi:MAG: F0F1 ATP synthase subunit A [Oscillospiraceae bacterium]|nr:F0F1 ATP synthase subunit A [Oscillospiraceae bacterium]
MDISIGIHGAINIGRVTVYITDTLVSTWILMGVLIAFAIVVRIKIRKFNEVPTGFQNVVEALVELFDNYLRNTVGNRLMFLGNWFFTLFVFILLSNIGGVIPGFRPPTADWSMTIALAVVTFALIQIIGVKFQGMQYIRGLFRPMFLFFPINLIGELARPVSISFRLFGNMLAGLIIMSLIYSVAPIFARFVIPAALHAYFDIFSGVLQAYIFVTLSMSFVADAAKLEDT